MTILSEKGPYKGPNGLTWDIRTDMDPETLSAVGLKIAKLWIDFAMGRAGLGGKSLMHPTGRYASSIQFRRTGVASVAIMAMETPDNPEAALLETGHKKIDLKDYFARGQVIPMFRGAEGQYDSAGYGKPVLNKTAFGKRKNIWAVVRRQGAAGYARVGLTGWVIPAMPAYSPAAHLVDLFRNEYFNG